MTAEPQDFDWRREFQRRLDELEDKVGATDSKVDSLVIRQQLQHESNTKKLDEQEQSIKRIGRMLIGEKGDNGLVGSVAALNGKINLVTVDIAAVKTSVVDLKGSFERLPKNILIAISILGGILTLISFLGPSLRKAVGLPAAHVVPAQGLIIHHPASMDSSIPSSVATNTR